MTDSVAHLVLHLKSAAAQGCIVGSGSVAERTYRDRCRSVHEGTGCCLVFTRERLPAGHSVQRYLHLSITFRDVQTGAPTPFDRILAETWCQAFFGAQKQSLFVEGPDDIRGPWHYRLPCDRKWKPLGPRVRSRLEPPDSWQPWERYHSAA